MRNLPRNTCFCPLLRISQKCEIHCSTASLPRCCSLLLVCFHKRLHCLPHFPHLLNLIWSEGFLHLLLHLLCRREPSIASAIGRGWLTVTGVWGDRRRNHGLSCDHVTFGIAYNSHYNVHCLLIKLQFIRNVRSSCRTFMEQVTIHHCTVF